MLAHPVLDSQLLALIFAAIFVVAELIGFILGSLVFVSPLLYELFLQLSHLFSFELLASLNDLLRHLSKIGQGYRCSRHSLVSHRT